ncbi:MAG TPA: radical SAM protein [Eudoraea sp.]|nr:radical SAM protein [Eudoraea sp.]
MKTSLSNILFSHSYYYPLDSKQWRMGKPYPPLGTLYAASLMRNEGYHVNLFDTNLRDNPYEITAVLEKERPKYLVLYDDGFNYLTKMCLTTMREAAFTMLALGKEHHCITIVCSSDSTDHYKKYMDHGADYVIQGEGEVTLKELVGSLERNKPLTDIRGLIHKGEDGMVVNVKRAVLQNLDELPLPAWDLVDMTSYRDVWRKHHREFTLNIATTRGCPFKCNWCAKPIYGNRYNSHSPEYIVQHIKQLQERFGVNRFWMCDDIFGLKPNWVQQFNKVLKKEEVQLKYYIQSRVDLLLKEDTIEALVQSGLEEVWVGAESGSQKILDAMDKGTSVAQIYKATRLLKDQNVRVSFFIQFGYLGETREDITKTINMIKELLPDDLGISVSYPLPGTKFYEKVKNDLNLKRNWTDSDDLAMMFRGSYDSPYYRKLHRYVHKEYRKSKGIEQLKALFKNPLNLSYKKMRAAVLYFYYAPTALINLFQLKRMRHTHD